jgi:hypothetical protein
MSKAMSVHVWSETGMFTGTATTTVGLELVAFQSMRRVNGMPSFRLLFGSSAMRYHAGEAARPRQSKSARASAATAFIFRRSRMSTGRLAPTLTFTLLSLE